MGWRLNDTKIVLVPGTTVRITDDTVFSAIWKARDFSSYTVSFNANGGDGLYGPVAGVSGTYTLPECVFTPPAGKQFKAWEVGGVQYAPGDEITVFANKRVIAVWEDVHVIRFVSNGDTGTMAPVTMTDGEFTVPECTFEAPAGMQFKAWRGLSCEYEPGETIDVSSNVVLTAVYESSTLLVSVTGYITSTGDEDADISVKLFKQGESTPWMEAVRNGNRVAYIFNYLTPGTYVLKVSKAGHLEYSATIDALTEDVIHNVTLEAIAGDVLCGDVNLDGSVNSIDSNLMKRKVAGDYEIAQGSDSFKSADINGDGQINAVDSNLLKRMVSGDYQP